MCACVSVGLPCVCMYVGRSALCVSVVCLVCHGVVCACIRLIGLPCVFGLPCVLVGLPCVCRSVCLVCVGRCVGRSALCVGRSALCVGVDCANFVNLYEIKLNQIVVLPLHGAGENVISYLVQPH